MIKFKCSTCVQCIYKSKCVLFVWFIYRVFQTICFCIYTLFKKIQHSKSVWSSHYTSEAVWRKIICHENAGFQSRILCFFLERALAIGTEFLNVLLLFNHGIANEWRGIKYTHIYMYTYSWNTTEVGVKHQSINHYYIKIVCNKNIVLGRLVG